MYSNNPHNLSLSSLLLLFWLCGSRANYCLEETASKFSYNQLSFRIGQREAYLCNQRLGCFFWLWYKTLWQENRRKGNQQQTARVKKESSIESLFLSRTQGDFKTAFKHQVSCIFSLPIDFFFLPCYVWENNYIGWCFIFLCKRATSTINWLFKCLMHKIRANMGHHLRAFSF